jgi:hypothetical protein
MGDQKDPKQAPPAPTNQTPPQLPTVPANRVIEGDNRGQPNIITGRK